MINWPFIVEACKKRDPKAQEQLYRYLYPGMIKLCLRYCKGQEDAASAVFNQGMLKVFTNIGQYAGRGAFEAWSRRIIVNACIDYCRESVRFRDEELKEETADLFPIIPDAYNRINGNEIIKLLYELPKNTGLVFNLFAMDGYRHEEIGRMLGISAGTSKWHVNEARKLLKQKLETLFKKEQLANAI